MPGTIIRGDTDSFAIGFGHTDGTRVNLIRFIYSGRYSATVRQIVPVRVAAAILGRAGKLGQIIPDGAPLPGNVDQVQIPSLGPRRVAAVARSPSAGAAARPGAGGSRARASRRMRSTMEKKPLERCGRRCSQGSSANTGARVGTQDLFRGLVGIHGKQDGDEPAPTRGVLSPWNSRRGVEVVGAAHGLDQPGWRSAHLVGFRCSASEAATALVPAR
jgi:hypothetical protein